MYKRNFFLFIKIFNTHKNRLPQTSTGTMCLLVNPDLRPVGPHPDDNSGLRLPLVQDRRQKGPPTDDNSGRRLSLVPDRRRQEGSPPDDDCLGLPSSLSLLLLHILHLLPGSDDDRWRPVVIVVVSIPPAVGPMASEPAEPEPPPQPPPAPGPATPVVGPNQPPPPCEPQPPTGPHVAVAPATAKCCKLPRLLLLLLC